jgi:dolichyl-phosphate beta-glucosyltransferase
MDTLPKAAVIVPCFNEADRLIPDKFLKAMEDYRYLHFVFVNDGSGDHTQKILEELSALSPSRIFTLNLESNQGKSEAVRKGFLFAMHNDFDYLGYWDADLATPLYAILNFIKILEANPTLLMIMGARVKLLGKEINRKSWRHYLGRIFATCAGIILQCDVYDTQCGAKLFRNTEMVQKVFLTSFVSKWFFDIEIIARLSRFLKASGRDIEKYIFEYPLEQWVDVNGSKLKFHHFAVAAVDLAKIAFTYYHKRSG